MKTPSNYLKLSIIGLLALGLSATLSGQEHAGHSHEEETGHGETYDQHEEHDSHGSTVGAAGEEHKHSEEKEHGESHETHTGHDEHGGHGEHGEGPVNMTPSVMREFGIVVGKAGPGVLHETVVLPGEIQYNQEAIAYVTPRYEGTVLSINSRLADAVKKGDVLATLESTETLRPFELKAPFDGVIVAYDVTQGQTVEAGLPLFTVADLSTVWADLQVYQRNIAEIHRGQKARIEGGHLESGYTGDIAYVAPTVDEHTRTGLARIVVDNTNGRWKPGQFIKGIISTDEQKAALLVPRSAVLKIGDEAIVFVQDEDGFEPRPVELGSSDAESWEVISGLKPGETIVVENPISVKAEMGKGSFGGHNH